MWLKKGHHVKTLLIQGQILIYNWGVISLFCSVILHIIIHYSTNVFYAKCTWSLWMWTYLGHRREVVSGLHCTQNPWLYFMWWEQKSNEHVLCQGEQKPGFPKEGRGAHSVQDETSPGCLFLPASPKLGTELFPRGTGPQQAAPPLTPLCCIRETPHAPRINAVIQNQAREKDTFSFKYSDNKLTCRF